MALSTRPVRQRVALLLAALAVVLTGILAAAGTASAHAELLSSMPADQEVLATSPTEIALQFTEAVDPIEPAIRLVDANGDDVEIGDVEQSPGPAHMRVALPAELADGTYVIAWQALSADSHRVRGSITFSVGAPSTVSAGVVDGLFDATADSSTDSLLLAIGRFVSYAGIGLLVGALVMTLALAPTQIGTRRVGILLIAAAELAFVGTLWMVVAQANLIGGSFTALGSVAETQSGQWWLARLVTIVLFSVLIALRSRLAVRGGVVVVAALGLGVLGVTAAGGHAVSGDDVALGLASTLVHLAAMAIWFGGLAVVLVAPAGGRSWNTAIGFSPWALGSVVALAVTGGVNGWRQLGTLSDLTESAYGRWLVVKLVLVVLVVGIAAFSRFTVHRRDSDSTDRLRRSVGLELAGIVLILGATAGLVNSPPPVATAEIASASVVVDGRVAQVELEPAVTGGTEMHVYLSSPSGSLDRADDITVRAELPEQDIPPFDVEVFPAGANHVVGVGVNLPVPGLWTFEVTARYGEFDQVVFSVQLPVSG
jgi:copper transport protein